MPEKRPQARQKQKQQSSRHNPRGPTSAAQRGSNSLLNRKKLETPKQKFERLLTEGNKVSRKKINDSDNNTDTELEVISPTGTVEIDWESHPQARSGCFIASVVNKTHHINAKLEDEADNRIYTFSDQAEVKTHVLPLGQVGDTAYFDVVNSSTGETAVARTTTHKASTGNVGGWFNNLFS